MLWCRFQGDPLLSFPESLCHFKSHLFRVILPFKPTLFLQTEDLNSRYTTVQKSQDLSHFSIWRHEARLSCRFFKVFLSNCSPDFLKEFQSFSLDIGCVFTNFSPVIVLVLTFKLVRITLIIWNLGLFYYNNGFPLRRSKMLHHCVINIIIIIINKIVKNKSCQRNTWFTGKKVSF